MAKKMDSAGSTNVIAIDPGTEKCGLAVLDESGLVRVQEIVAAESLAQRVAEVAKKYAPAVLVVGDRTGSKRFLERLEREGITRLVKRVEAVDEHLTSQEARRRYLQRRRSRSLLYRLIPLGMQVPDRPYDDYVAVILAERYLRQRSKRLH
ncbi:MAG: pre-16S rRNA-processing nuclease YqgF [Firmicutes bacterium]|nr:pre-16S rRNA-processing nuclease YqgF [Bacillota bacterium]